MAATERKLLIRGLLIGTALGLLMSVGFVGISGDASWFVFSITLGWAFGLGLAIWLQRRDG